MFGKITLLTWRAQNCIIQSAAMPCGSSCMNSQSVHQGPSTVTVATPTQKASPIAVPHKDFSDLDEKMSGKGASASEAHGCTAGHRPPRRSQIEAVQRPPRAQICLGRLEYATCSHSSASCQPDALLSSSSQRRSKQAGRAHGAGRRESRTTAAAHWSRGRKPNVAAHRRLGPGPSLRIARSRHHPSCERTPGARFAPSQ